MISDLDSFTVCLLFLCENDIVNIYSMIHVQFKIASHSA